MRGALVVTVVLALGLQTGCVIDRTGRSGTSVLQRRVDATRDRARALEQDLAQERERIDIIDHRAAEARRRYADSGASVQAMMEDLSYLRGEVSALKHRIEELGRVDEDTDFRLTVAESQLAHIEVALVGGLEGYEPAPLVMPGMMEPSTPAPEAPSETEAPLETEAPTEAAPAEPPAEASAVEPRSEEPPAEETAPDAVYFQSALVLVQDRNWKEAGARLQRFQRKFPQSAWRQEAQYLIGQCLYELGRFKAAITEYQRVIVADEESEWAPRAMYMQGMSFLALGTTEDLDAAQVFFAELVRLYPNSGEAARAQQKIEELNAG